ncbi:MAG: rRNA maturation RNase YbeY [Breznakibacter sp.]
MTINFYAEDVGLPKINKAKLKKWIGQISENELCSIGDISVVFVSDQYLLQMNVNYLSHDYLTDIITFDYSYNNNGKRVISGDLFISIDRIEFNSKDYQVAFEHELHRVIIHGVLHLIGFKDKTQKEFRLMKEKENESLEILKTIN